MKHSREDYNRRIQDTENLIPADEPVFLLRGQDPAAPAAIEMWCQVMELLAVQTGADNKAIIDTARAQASKMKLWQTFNNYKVADL